jgi:hypothetical protein
MGESESTSCLSHNAVVLVPFSALRRGALNRDAHGSQFCECVKMLSCAALCPLLMAFS